jgi:hypothetical protein
LIVGEKLNYCSIFDCSKQKEFKERSSGNAQNKYELKMKFPEPPTILVQARCDRKTNGIESKRNSKVTGVGFTNNIIKKV